MESLGPARERAPIRQAVVVPIEDPSQVSVARRAVLEVGRRLELDEETLARAEIVAVELAHNILIHGKTVVAPSVLPVRRIVRAGEMVVSSTVDGVGLQIVAVDAGVGIPNVARAMEDGYSTSTTPGLGLGAVRRLSQDFDVFSALEPAGSRGTVVASVLASAARGAIPAETQMAVVSTALPGEHVNGDSWAVQEADGSTLILMVDGLGHGQYAFEAATLAVESFYRFAQGRPAGSVHSPSEILVKMHPLMRATRGAAIALLRIDPAIRSITFCGVGNISAVLSDPYGATRSMVSHNGTIGHQMPRAQEFVYTYQAGTLLILHSDGITTSWKLQATPGLDRRSAATVAGAIYRDAWRGRDDSTVMVVRLV